MIVLIGAVRLHTPFWNWDMLPYMAASAELEGASPGQAHDQAYSDAARHVPTITYAQLVDSTNAYRAAMLTDTTAFADQLPFYWIKPLYIASVWSIWKCGIPLTRATVWPSFICFLVLAFALFELMSREVPTHVAAAVAALFAALPCVNEIAGLSTPDALSASLVLLAVLLLTGAEGPALGIVLLALSIAARADNAIVAVLLLVAQPWYAVRARLRIIVLLGGALLLVATYLYVDHLGCAHGWCVRPISAFLPRSLHPGSEVLVMSPGKYMEAVRKGAESLRYTWVIEFTVLAVLGMAVALLGPRSRGRTTTWRVLAVMTMAMVARYLFFPVPDDRALVPWYALITLASAASFERLLRDRWVKAP